MGAEDFKRGVVSILLAFALVFSMILVAPLASSGDWVNNPEPGGTTIDVVQGGTFLIRHVLEWNEAQDGAYGITIAWDCYDNEPSENFTFLENSAYFTTGDNMGESILAEVTWLVVASPDYPGSTRYILSVKCPANKKDSRDGRFNVDITLNASGVGGVPHIPGDHVIPFQSAGIIIVESSMKSWNRDPVTIRVLGRGVSVSISPSEDSGLPTQTLSYTVTVKNTGDLDDNYDLTVSDNAGWAPTLSEYLLEVPAGENRQTTLSVTVPANALGSTEDNLTVTATSRADNTFENDDSCIAHAEIVRSVSVSISPGYQENLPSEDLIYDVTVGNTGNIADTYTLENSDDAGWLLSLENTSLTIPPFESRPTKLTVTIPENASPCTNDNIRVIATSQENENVIAENSCIAHVQVVRGVSVSIQPVYKSGAPGTTIDYTVTVKNTGNAKDDYRLENGDDLGWTLVLSQNLLENIQPGENKTTTLDVTIPNDAAGCTIDSIWVAATSMENEDVKDNENCQAHAAIVRSVDVSISPSENGAPPGTTLTYIVTVTNTGNVLDNYTLENTDNMGWGLSLSVNLLEIPAGENETVTLSVTIPGDAEYYTEDLITVTATSQENENIWESASCIAHATPPRSVEVSISPSYQEGTPGVTLNYTVTVKNTGALDDNYDLTASDNAGWSLSISPTSLTVPVGENGNATLSVTIPEIASACTRDNVTLVATSQADNTVSAENSCIAHAVGPISENLAVIYPTADVYAFGDENGYSRSQLKFDMSGIPSGAGIISAKLWLYRLAADSWDGNVTLYRVENQVWDETITATGFDAQTLTDENNHAGKFVVHGWDYLNVLTQLKVDYDAAHTYISFRLRWTNDNGSEPPIGIDDGRFLMINSELDELSIIFPSSEYGGNGPYLEVVYVPPYAVSVSISPSYQSGSPGEELSYTVMVANMGNLDDNYVLTVGDNAGWGPMVFPTSLAIPSGSTGEAVLSVIVPENVPPCTRDNIMVTATSTENLAVSASASCLAHQMKAEFSLVTLYKVHLDLTIYLSEGSKLVAKFYTWWDTFQAENVVWSGTTPDHVVLLEDIPHPQGKVAVQKVELVLTDAEGVPISTIIAFTVRKVTLETRYSEIPMWWAAASPEEKVELEVEYTEIPMWWAAAPS
ncbi:hypothetical protein ES703_10098 [subsurface metagenome]